MPSRIGNFGQFPGDRRDPKKRPGYGYHPPACTCYKCVEGRRKAEARRVAEATDRELRYGHRPTPKPTDTPTKPPKPKKEPRQKAPKPPKPKRELPERTEEQKARDAKLGGIILIVLVVLVVLAIVGVIWGAIWTVGFVREQVSGWSMPAMPEVSAPKLPEMSMPKITVPSQVTEFSMPETLLPSLAAPDPDAPAPAPAYVDEIERHIIAHTNDYRSFAGAPPLAYNPELAAVARAHAENMARQRTLSHDLDGQGPGGRAKAAGYECISGMGENIINYPTSHDKLRWPWSDEPNWNPLAYDVDPERIAWWMVIEWMGSEGHRANMFDPNFRSIGVGVASVESVRGTGAARRTSTPRRSLPIADRYAAIGG